MPRGSIHAPEAQFMTEGQFTRRKAQFIARLRRAIDKGGQDMIESH